MVSFSKARDMFRIQKEAKRIKKELAKVHVEAEGRFCMVVVNAEQEVISITIKDGAPLDQVGSDIVDAMNRALKKAQVVSAEKMKGIMDEMGMGMGE